LPKVLCNATPALRARGVLALCFKCTIYFRESRWYRRYMFFQPVLVITRAGFLFILTMKE
jgi:uncharacterized Fe-S cluster-containing radical SAM superfamily protein